ncbi:MAG: PilT protein domain protein [Caulobacteraceae bacterium]|jgi:ribonuclease VapC|nr:PilT protein domain protein [Caulobacteraceae bacterium]
MVIDSSAFLAILLDEPERPAFTSAIAADPVRLASAATLLETSIVSLGRVGEAGLSELRSLFTTIGVETTPFGPDHIEVAIDAFRRFGKGRHPAGLNFGDCFSYALAKATGEPLLFKGDDFSQTDIQRAV